MASLSRFSDVLEKKLNTPIQNAIPEEKKTKILRKYGKKMNLKYQFDSFTQRIVAVACIINIGCLNKLNLFLQKLYRCYFMFSSVISTKTITILALISISNR